jgi:hypothetical protein
VLHTVLEYPVLRYGGGSLQRIFKKNIGTAWHASAARRRLQLQSQLQIVPTLVTLRRESGANSHYRGDAILQIAYHKRPLDAQNARPIPVPEGGRSEGR